MRKFILAVVLVALGAGLIATSASAFDSHFKVLGKDKSGHRVGQTASVSGKSCSSRITAAIASGTTASPAGIRATTVRGATPSSA